MIRLPQLWFISHEIFVKFYAEASCHTLSLFNESMQEVTKITEVFFLGKMKTMWQFGERGNGIDRGN